MKIFFDCLTDTHKGIILIIIGCVLLLYALGIFQQTLNTVIIITAIAMILYGFFKANTAQKFTRMLSQKKDDSENNQ